MVDESGPLRRTFPRRSFLIGGGVAVGGLGAVGGLLFDELAGGLGTALGPPTLTRFVRRREDLLVLRFDFYNLVRDTRAGAKPQIIRKSSALPAFVVVTFPPQHVAEETFYEANPNDPPPTIRPARSIVAGPSRVAFQVPAGAVIPFTYAGLLGWSSWALNVAPAADNQLQPLVRAPLAHETSIELPWRLLLSPPSAGAFTHSATPVVHAGRTELWHTRMGVAAGGYVDERKRAERSVRAIWTVDESNGALDPFSAGRLASDVEPLTAQDRRNIFHQTTGRLNFEPVEVERLFLSAIGGWFEGHREWLPTDPATGDVRPLAEWRHRATMGRDHYVKVAYRGFLFPFGHPAMVIHVAERKFTGTKHPLTAYVRKRKYVAVAVPRLAYDSSTHSLPQLRQFPFRSVELLTKVTPDLAAGTDDTRPFVPSVQQNGGAPTPFFFEVKTVDLDGNVHHVRMPMAFVGIPEPVHPSGAPVPVTGVSGPQISALFQAAAGAVDFAGQRVAYAAPSSAAPGATTFETAGLVFDAAVPTSFSIDLSSVTSPFTPVVKRAEVALRAAAAVSKQAEGLVSFAFAGSYLTNEFGTGNVGGTFAQLVTDTGLPTQLDIGMPAQVAGGLATPALAIEGLSRDLGPVGGDLVNFAKTGNLDIEKLIPKDAIAGLLPKLLGSLDLADVLPRIDGPGNLLPGKSAPKIDTTLEYTNGKAQPPTGSTTTFDWLPGVRNFGPLVVDTPAKSVFELHATSHTVFAHPEDTTVHTWGRLTNVKVQLFGDSPFLIVPVNRFAFDARTGAKSDLTVDVGEIVFGPPLDFIADLAKLLRFGGKGGPFVDVDEHGVTAGINLILPNIQVGVFQLSNLMFDVQAALPFQGEMSVQFALAKREHPAVLAIACFGGGAWFELVVGLKGLQRLDVGFEFGASVALDLGVASGEIHLMAGIYLQIDNTGPDPIAKLGGYLRFGGSLSVLGIVTVSIELQIGFEYDIPNQEAVGYGTLHLEVDIFMFSKSFDVAVERRFGGKAHDPRFLDQVQTDQDWTSYCDAFAPIGV